MGGTGKKKGQPEAHVRFGFITRRHHKSFHMSGALICSFRCECAAYTLHHQLKQAFNYAATLKPKKMQMLHERLKKDGMCNNKEWILRLMHTKTAIQCGLVL